MQSKANTYRPSDDMLTLPSLTSNRSSFPPSTLYSAKSMLMQLGTVFTLYTFSAKKRGRKHTYRSLVVSPNRQIMTREKIQKYVVNINCHKTFQVTTNTSHWYMPDYFRISKNIVVRFAVLLHKNWNMSIIT